MLRLLSIRNFVVVASLDVEFERGLTVLTGETGAGKSILLDALSLLLGDRFELRQLRPGAERAELAAVFDTTDTPAVDAWLAEQELTGDGDEVLLRRVLDAQGRSRAWINGRPATLAHLKDLGERLVDLHGQHAHQSLAQPESQRDLVDAFGGFTTLAREVADSYRAWRAAIEQCAAAAHVAQATSTEREFLDTRRRELAALNITPTEWAELSAAQSRLANAADLIDAATQGSETLAEGDGALTLRLAQLTQRLKAAAVNDPALSEVVALLEPAAVELEEAARALRDYLRRLDLDPQELQRVEGRLSAIHDLARRHRVRPEALPALLAETEARLAALAESADAEGLARRAAEAEVAYRAHAEHLAPSLPLHRPRQLAPQRMRHDREEQHRGGDPGHEQSGVAPRVRTVAHVEQHDCVDHEHHDGSDVDQHLEDGDHVHAEERVHAGQREHRHDEREGHAHRMAQHQHQRRGNQRGGSEEPKQDGLDHLDCSGNCATLFGG